jgi:hypothetical protein
VKIQKRIEIERKVVRNLIRTAKAHGYALHSVDDGEERHIVKTEREALEAVFAVDESRIYFKHPDEAKRHVACIVLGNGGWDAVADASMGTRWDDAIEEAGRYAEKFCD